MKYRREIDGLRALAVLPVILFHAGFNAFSGGFIGVDVFFVISGYLITTIILADKEKGKFSLVTFYDRRARRILPALFFVMFCCIPFAWFWLLPNHLKDFSKSLVAVSAFSSNILFWSETGYFETASELKPLLHTWSLAVEEQYYVLFPLYIMFMWKFRKRWIVCSLLVIAVASLAVAQWGAYNKPAATFFLLPTRGWELAIGALIAFYSLYKKDHAIFVTSNKTINEFCGFVGIALIGYSIYAFDNSTPFPSFYALIPTIGTALIIVFTTPQTIVGRFLGAKAMVGIGLISYSTYLWHQPLFVFARHRSLTEPSVSLLLTLSAASIVLAYISWRYVEMPFRDRQVITRKRIFSFAVIGSLAFAATGITGHINNGFDKRTNENGLLLADISNKTIVNYGLSEDCEGKFNLSENCRTSDEPEILLWGDSFAMHLVQGILESNPDAKIIQMTASVCGPFFDVAPVRSKKNVNWAKGCLEFNNEVHDWLKSNKTVKYVVLSSCFSQYFDGYRLLIDNKLYASDKQLITEKFVQTITELKKIGVTPIVFSPPPTNGQNVGQCLVKHAQYGSRHDSCDFRYDDISEGRFEVYDFLKDISQVAKVVFFDQEICKEGICCTCEGDVFIFRDGGHLLNGHFSKEGSAFIGKKMDFYDLIVSSKNIHASQTSTNDFENQNQEFRPKN